jgi:hypothetical protein
MVSKLFLTLLDTDEDTYPITHPRLAAASEALPFCRHDDIILLFKIVLAMQRQKSDR